MTQLIDQIFAFNEADYDLDIVNQFHQRAVKGKLTRDEHIHSHFCVYFLLFDPKKNLVFLGHHKKSGLWIPTGGHIDQGETMDETVVREADEELGMKLNKKEVGAPRFLTITKIDHETIPCRKHFDIWYILEIDSTALKIDQEKFTKEFFEGSWMSFGKANNLVKDKNTLHVLDKIQEKNLKNPT